MSSLSVYFYRPAASLTVNGEDSPVFLQSQFSNDLAGMEPGRGCVYGLWLDHKGKVQGDSWILREEEEAFRVFSYASAGAGILERLEAHIIADDVEVAETEAVESISLYGPASGSFLGDQGIAVPEPHGFSVGEGVRVFAGRRGQATGYEVVLLTPGAKEHWHRLVHSAIECGHAARASQDLLSLERIRSGIPLVPVEIGPGDLPGEGALEKDAVSFTKGCFLGQEVVARMHHVGRARRGLFRVSGSGAPPAVPVEVITGSGEPAGELRSAVVTGDLGWKGMALLKKHKATEPVVRLLDGTSVEIEAERLDG